MNRFLLYFYRAFLLISFVLKLSQVHSQCGFLNKQENGNTYYPRTTNQSVGIGNAAFLRFQCKNTANYNFNVCGFTGYDSQLTGWNSSNTGTSIFYNDDNGPSCSGTAASIANYACTFDGTIFTQINRYNCQNWGSGYGSATLNYSCSPPSSPSAGTAGNGTWNVFCYDAGDAAGGSGAWSSNYSGYYTENNLSFSTGSRWSNTPYDANSASGQAYRGCYILNDNHSWRAIRTNFTCGRYQIDIPTHDDAAILYVNGAQVFAHTNGCCDNHTNVWTGALGPNSTVEFRVSEGGGGSAGQITVTNLGSISINSSSADMCEGATRTLSANVSGGSFSGTGVSGTTFTAPTQPDGTNFTDYVITFTIDGCNATQTIRVYNTLAFTSSAADMCEGSTRTLTASTPATTFSGTGVSGSTFTAPAQADGTNYTDYVITATHTGNACGTSTTQTIRVYNTLAFTSSAADMCEGSTRTLTASTPATTFSGTGVSGSTFTAPAQADGTNYTDYVITATHTGNACGTSTTQTIRVYNTLAFTSSAADMCEGSTRTLTASTPATTFSGTGVSGSTFTAPAQANGTNYTDYVITATHTGNACGTSTTQTIRVYNTLAFTSSAADMCEGSTRTLTASTPATTFSGTGVSGSTFTAPAQADGTNYTDYVITATHTGNACGTSTTQTIRVYNTLAFTSSAADMCEGSTRTLTASTPATTFSGTGVSGSTFTAPAQANGTNYTDYVITATHTGNACGTSTTQTIRVYNTLAFTSSAADMCEGSTRTLTASTPATTFSGTGVSGSTFTAPAQADGTNYTDYVITATHTGNACGTSTTQTIRVYNTLAFTSSAADMCEGSTRTLTASTPATTFSGTGVSGSTFTAPAQADGTNYTDYLITATHTGNACGTSTTQTIRVYNTLAFTNSNADLCEGSTVTLTASTPSAVFSGTGVSGSTFTAPNQSSGLASTSYLITATHTGNACGTTATQNINSLNYPTISPSPSAVCESSTATFGADIAVNWSSGSGSISGAGVFSPANVSLPTQFQSVSISATNSICSSNSSIQVDNQNSITSFDASICETGVSNLTGDVSGVVWTTSHGSVSTPGVNSVLSGVSVSNPSVSQVVTVTAVNGSCTAQNASVTVANTPSTSNAGSDIFECASTSTTLGATNPSVGTGAWSIISGAGGTVTTPSSNTSAFSGSNQTTYVLRWTTSNAPCPNSTDDVEVRLNNPLNVTTVNGSNGTCFINSSTWHHIFDGSGRVIASLNSNGQNLGNTSVTANIAGSPGSINANNGPGNCDDGSGTAQMAYMARSLDIVPTTQPSSGVNVRLYFTAAEFSALQAAAAANNSIGNHCADDDDLASISDLGCTKYATGGGPGGAGGVFVSQSANGTAFGGTYIEVVVNSFSSFYLHGSAVHGAPLPVTYANFTAQAVNNSYVRLDWITLTEINNDGFEVQRSTDGVNFTTLGWVEGNDNSNAPKVYYFEDRNALPNIQYYYRLKQIDNNTQFEYSNIVTAAISGGTVFTISPNPATDRLNVTFEGVSSGKGVISIINSVGQIVFEKNSEVVSGINNYDLDIRNLPQGTYTVSLSSNTEVKTAKLIVTR